jgi:hypothetical protein
MVLFVVAVVVVLLGVGAYDLYNPGARSITMAGYHFAAVPSWVPVALAAVAPLSLFLLHALWTGFRVWLLKGAVRRARDRYDLQRPWPAVERRVELMPVEPAPFPRRPAQEWRDVEPPPLARRPAQEWRDVERPPLARRPAPDWRDAERPPFLRRPVQDRSDDEPTRARPRRRRSSQGPPGPPGPQPATKRSWLPRD